MPRRVLGQAQPVPGRLHQPAASARSRSARLASTSAPIPPRAGRRPAASASSGPSSGPSPPPGRPTGRGPRAAPTRARPSVQVTRTRSSRWTTTWLRRPIHSVARSACTRTRPLAKTSPVGAGDLHGIVGPEGPGRPRDSRRQQGAPAAGQRRPCAVVDGQRPLEPQREGDPQLAGRQAALPGPEDRADTGLVRQGRRHHTRTGRRRRSRSAPPTRWRSSRRPVSMPSPRCPRLPGPPARRSSCWSISTTSSISDASASGAGRR